MDASRPLAAGSVSLRLYPHLELSAPEIVEEMRVQARLADEHGFDGVMTSEHHGGFAGYLPNPLQLAGFLLDAMPHGWAAACPILVTLRPPALVAEETAWLAARHPERVGLGVAAGALAPDFEVMGLDMRGLAARFDAALTEISALLRGEVEGVLAGDPAIARCRTHPVPLVSAAASETAALRAAARGAGMLLDSLSATERCRELANAYRAAGGAHAVHVVRRAWLGALPGTAFDAQASVYRSYTSDAAQSRWGARELLHDDDPAVLAARLTQALTEAGATACNIRVHVPGVDPEQAREQIVRLGDEVVPLVRAALAAS